MPITWTDNLNTGIEPIDAQHRQLVEYINNLEVAHESGDRKTVEAVFDDVIEYTLSHFAFEEQLQLDAGYKFASAHKSVHELFVKRVTKYRDRFDQGEDVSAELQKMLNSWLIHHIKRDDMSYVAEVKHQMTRLVEDKKETGWLSRSLGKFFGGAEKARKH